MHPEDVAEHVAASVEELRERLADHPELKVLDLSLEDATRLFITFEKEERQMVTQPVASNLVLPGGASLQWGYEVPDLGAAPVRRELILLVGLDDFDGQPPTAELLQPDRSPLAPGEWPKLGGGGIVASHRIFKRPFFCRRGLREYHTHSQHAMDPWDLHREGLPLHSIVLELLDDLQHRWVGRLQ